MYGGVEVQFHTFLAWVIDGCEWSASRPGYFTPGETASGTHWVGGWAEPRAGFEVVAKRHLHHQYIDICAQYLQSEW
jgi:hypothetical protein